MAHSPLTPVFVGLRSGLHVLSAALLVLVVVRVVVVRADTLWLSLGCAVLFAALYIAGAGVARVAAPSRVVAGAAWLAALTSVWAGLLVLVPEAAYLVFPLFFLYLHVLPRAVGPAVVLFTTGLAIVALGLHSGFTVGGVVGPLIGAGVALLIGLGYRALAREAAEREALVAELIATRDRLVASEREQGMLAERSRLARDIHDTVAQSLSSIQMLLHAAEAAAPDRPGAEHLSLARQTAADALADTRRFIRELSPPALDQGLTSALLRVAEQWQRDGLRVVVEAPPQLDLPMDTQTALLRITQGALANVAQHARADEAHVELTVEGDRVRLRVADDGVGFDTADVPRNGTDSFGLRAIRERVEQLDGTLVVESSPGRGTRLIVGMGVTR
ncbi:sensor histidine kinase [Schumannella soli]|uniref:Sensor histidine kinase n=1 Tax=Schumannella soli TaxID=2590779 RepID=A0A506XXS9_9MICO|nr:sensor histidine kinase [Schumannella soli]TPW77704.1 sensor histidine kinase [Schumannella soli]